MKVYALLFFACLIGAFASAAHFADIWAAIAIFSIAGIIFIPMYIDELDGKDGE